MSENPFEKRARELMLSPADKAAYLRLMNAGGLDMTRTCPDCHTELQTYETETMKHIRTCAALRAASAPKV